MRTLILLSLGLLAVTASTVIRIPTTLAKPTVSHTTVRARNLYCPPCYYRHNRCLRPCYFR